MVKIDVISGFLGAGKTTLIRKLFESAFKDEKVVMIENEFGEIGIDASFLKDSGIQIKEINAGCICCSLVGDFSSSIRELIDTYHPDRIIIEPSGVGKLSDIIAAVEHVGIDTLRLNILATVVDGPKAKMHLKNFGEFFLNQVESAHTVLIGKTDKMSESQIDEVSDLIREKNGHANIVTTPIRDFESATLLRILESDTSLKMEMIHEAEEEAHREHEHHEHHCHHDEEHHHEHHCHHDEEHHHDHYREHEECCCHDHHHDHEHHHDADEIFSSWGTETARSFSYDEIASFLTALKTDDRLGTILRAKGVLKAKDADAWYYFDYVSGDYEIRRGNPDYTGRIVVIGSKIDEKKIASLLSL